MTLRIAIRGSIVGLLIVVVRRRIRIGIVVWRRVLVIGVLVMRRRLPGELRWQIMLLRKSLSLGLDLSKQRLKIRHLCCGKSGMCLLKKAMQLRWAIQTLMSLAGISWHAEQNNFAFTM